MDIAITREGNEFDIAIADGDLVADAGLETAVVISLFSDRRAEADDEIPDGTNDPRGWWADSFLTNTGDRIGSRLWLLARSKQLASIRRRADEYMREALEWLVDDGIAATIETEVETGAPDVLEMQAVVRRGDPENNQEERFQYVWENV